MFSGQCSLNLWQQYSIRVQVKQPRAVQGKAVSTYLQPKERMTHIKAMTIWRQKIEKETQKCSQKRKFCSLPLTKVISEGQGKNLGTSVRTRSSSAFICFRLSIRGALKFNLFRTSWCFQTSWCFFTELQKSWLSSRGDDSRRPTVRWQRTRSALRECFLSMQGPAISFSINCFRRWLLPGWSKPETSTTRSLKRRMFFWVARA